MISALVTAQVWAESLRRAFREHWRRLLVGAFVGWAVASLVGALLLAVFSTWLTLALSNMLGAVFVWAGIGVGALTAYALRGRDARP